MIKLLVRSNLSGKHLDVVVERFGRANIVDDARLSRSARRQLRLLEDQGQERKERVAKNEEEVIDVNRAERNSRLPIGDVRT